MTTLYTSRPFNLRYAVRQRTGRYMPELLRTHRTAQASWLYIHRRHGIDDFGPTPDWSRRDDLVAAGRCAPARANDPALDGIRLWTQADDHANALRPDEPACAHAVGSLVVAIDPGGSSLVLQREDGRREMLDLAHLADRHIRPGWVRTIHSAQGATCDRVLAHLESFRANTVDARSVYVAISRARMGAAVYTDSRASLTDALGIRDGAQVGAIDDAVKVPDVVTATPASVRAAGMAIGE